MTINIPIVVDDDLFEKTINADFQNKVDKHLYSIIDNALIECDPSWGSHRSVKGGIEYLVESAIKKEVLGEWKDEIIERAAKILAERVGRSKAAKDEFGGK